jgi:ClpP class serine protease
LVFFVPSFLFVWKIIVLTFIIIRILNIPHREKKPKGGYMIACTSSPGRLFAAPFAIVGSIGVIGQAINIQRALEGWGIRPLVFRGGRDKAPVGLIGEVTQQGMDKLQSIIDDTHRAFQRHVVEARPCLTDTISEIATGDIWLGYDAMKVGLIDRIVTSDEYIAERIHDGARILKLVQLIRPKYPFLRPTTSTRVEQHYQPQSSSSGSLNSVLIPILSDFKSLLEKVTSVVSNNFGTTIS